MGRVTSKREELLRHLAIMEQYLRVRLELRDWHGVMDAAADIREIEAKLSVL